MKPLQRGKRWLFRIVPALDSLREYSWRIARADLIAGLTVAAVAVPQAMAYALIIGLPPQYGLYTAIVMTAVGALFDSSRQLINGPTNAISIAALSVLATFTGDARIEAAIALAVLVGGIQIGITLLRLGDLSRYISNAVIVGFTLGASVLLLLDQSKNLCGLETPPQSSHYFLLRFWQTLTHGGGIHGPTLAIGAASIALILVLRLVNRLLGRQLLPDLLLVVISTGAAVAFLKLDQKGIQVVGDIPRDLPAFSVPLMNVELLGDLGSSALAIAVLGLLEAIAMAKAIAVQTKQKLDINQQCLSEGVANFVGGFFHCFPGSGSLTRSAINQQAGALTQWSGIFSAVAVALTVLLAADYARYIPRAALAGILIVTAFRMIDRQQLLFHLRTTPFDRGVVLATALTAVFISVEFCILIGVFLSFVLYIPRAAKLRLTQLTLTPERVLRDSIAGDPHCERMRICNLEGELFFGSGPELEKHFSDIESQVRRGVRIVVLSMKHAHNPDAVSLALLNDFLTRLEQCGAILLVCGARQDMGQTFTRSGLAARLGARLFCESDRADSSTLDAVRHAYSLLNDDVCPNCPRRQQLTGSKEVWHYMI